MIMYLGHVYARYSGGHRTMNGNLSLFHYLLQMNSLPVLFPTWRKMRDAQERAGEVFHAFQ